LIFVNKVADELPACCEPKVAKIIDEKDDD
jgi:hypothetical protein